MATAPLIFDFDTTCFTTSTIAATPIVCATPTPSFSPKRKYRPSSDDTPTQIKRQRLSTTSTKTVEQQNVVSVPTTPLYKNFGNGISLCNNTKTNKFSNIEEILHFLTEEECNTTTTSALDRCNTSTISDDIANELMIELSCKNELPELNNVLFDLKDVLRSSDFDFIL
uniref:Uncharacterized protein n=1 Tax=Clytia hemisphaerica TaxID=252671 RepID=A0A7M5VBM1_9CNID|eukprot:TCONS_00027219-protein